MTIEEKTFALLSAATGVTTYVPADRIKPPGDWEKMVRPYIVHFPVSASPDQLHGAQMPLTEWAYQVSIFVDVVGKNDGSNRGYSSARTIAKAVVDALKGQHGDACYFWNGQTNQQESDPPIHHIALSFQVFEAL